MCVICAKPSGVDFPTEDIIRKMWYANDDGAGLCYARNNSVYIHKGYMDVESYLEAVKGLQEKYGNTLPVIFHFRIGTAGGNISSNTHPFPVVNGYDDMKKLHLVTNLAVAHNGCIPIDNDVGVSDTMTYIKDYMSLYYRLDNNFYKKKIFQKYMLEQTGSKLAFLNSSGEIVTIGSFSEENGLLFSNLYWKFRGNRYSYHSGVYSGYSWRDYDDDDYDSPFSYNKTSWCSKLGCYVYEYGNEWKYWDSDLSCMRPVPIDALSSMGIHIENYLPESKSDEIATVDLKLIYDCAILNRYFEGKLIQAVIADAWVDKYGGVYFEPETESPFVKLDDSYYLTDGSDNILNLENEDWFNNKFTISPVTKCYKETVTDVSKLVGMCTRIESDFWEVTDEDECATHIPEWDGLTEYTDNDIVSRNGGCYICLADNKGKDPSLNKNSFWWYEYTPKGGTIIS